MSWCVTRRSQAEIEKDHFVTGIVDREVRRTDVRMDDREASTLVSGFVERGEGAEGAARTARSIHTDSSGPGAKESRRSASVGKGTRAIRNHGPRASSPRSSNIGVLRRVLRLPSAVSKEGFVTNRRPRFGLGELSRGRVAFEHVGGYLTDKHWRN